MTTEREIISLDKARHDRSDLTPEDLENCRPLKAQIAKFAIGNLGAKLYEPMPGGHLRTYALSERSAIDYARQMRTSELVITVEETSCRRAITDGEEEITGEIVIAPNRDQVVLHYEVVKHYFGGGVSTTSSGYALSPSELSHVYSVLANGSTKDPRQVHWSSMATPS